MLTVHHLNNSRSQRVLWLLEELGAPYTIKRYQRDPKTMLAPSELMLVHPLGKSPVITHNGVTAAETGAIVEYILGRHGALANHRSLALHLLAAFRRGQRDAAAGGDSAFQ